MALDSATNFAKSDVSIGYNAVATSVVLATGGGARFTDPAPFNVTWFNSTDYTNAADDPNREIVRVTDVTGDTLTVTRGQENTTASVKNLAGKTYTLFGSFTAKGIKDLNARLGSQVVAFASTINTDASKGSTIEVGTLTGNLTIANPTNPQDTQILQWYLKQDGTGSRGISLGNKFKIPSSATSPLTFSTGANKEDVLSAKYRLSNDSWYVFALIPGY